MLSLLLFPKNVSRAKKRARDMNSVCRKLNNHIRFSYGGGQCVFNQRQTRKALGTKLVPTLHPSFFYRNIYLLNIELFDLKTAVKLANDYSLI